MPNDDEEYFFSEVTETSSFRSFDGINGLLEEGKAVLRVGPALGEEGKPCLGRSIGIYRRKEAFSDPALAQVSLAEAYRREFLARFQYPAYAPSEPEIPERYRTL